MFYRLMNDGSRLQIEHNGKDLVWDISGFNRTAIAKGQDELNHLNMYIAWEGLEWQDKVFAKLEEINNLFGSFGQFEAKQKRLRKLIGEMFEYINPNNTIYWVDCVSTIRMATNLKDDYAESDKDYDKTFLRTEYLDILAVTIWLKLLIGVFGTYLELNKNKLGTTFKEYGTLRLLDETWLITSSYVERLLRYIDAWIRQTGNTDVAVLGGLSSSELPMFVLAHIMIRKLATGNVEDNLNNGGVIVSIYHGVQSALTDLKRKFPLLHDKKQNAHDYTSGEERGNQSVAELYMITQNVRQSDIALYRYYIHRIDEHYRFVDETLPKEQLLECLENIDVLMKYDVETHLVLITQWVLQSFIPCQMVYNLNKNELLKLAALSQALLWHWGFKDLAVLITAESDRTQLVSGVHVNKPPIRVKTDPMGMLDKLYPHQKAGKTKSKESNLAYSAIMSVTDTLANYWLTFHHPSYMQTHAEQLIVDDRGGLIPEDLTTQLTELLVKIGQISK